MDSTTEKFHSRGSLTLASRYRFMNTTSATELPFGTCSEYHGWCNHFDQITLFPQGSKVVAIIEIKTGGGLPNVPIGTVGTVKSHCTNDGRAVVSFGPGPNHTFHQPLLYFRTA